jgi:hypothetical protein
MITKANFILVATVAGEKYVFEYQKKDLDEVLEEFYIKDYPKFLINLKDNELFPLEVLDCRPSLGGLVANTLKTVFHATLYRTIFDIGSTVDGPYTFDDFHKDLMKARVKMDREEKYDNKATSLLFYMWNRWCLEECKIVFKDGDWNHFWNKWCGYNSEYGRFGAVEDFYASLTNDNRDKLVRRACEMYDGSREKY